MSEGEDSSSEIATESEGEDSNAEITTESEGEDSNAEITTESEGEDSNAEIATESEGEDSNAEIATESEGEDSNAEIATESEGEDSNTEIATDSEGEGSNAEIATSTENEDSDADKQVSRDINEELKENYQNSNDSDDSDDSDEEEESLEYQSFCQHSSQLLHVILISNPEHFAKRLFSAHIISGRALSNIQKRRGAKRGGNIPSDKKTKKLLKILKNLIQADPGKFESLLEVMSQYSRPMAGMAVKLRRKCGNRLSTCHSLSTFVMHQKLSSSSSDRLKENPPSTFTASFFSPPHSDGSRVGTDDYSTLSTFLRSNHLNTSQVVIEDLVIKNTENAQIDAGSFGDVWKGIRSGSPCAVKVLHGVNLFLPLNGRVKSEKQEKFESECQFLQRLDHTNIVRYLQRYIHPESGTPLLAMELMDENLTNFLVRYRETFGNRLNECVQIKICKDVAKALNYLHGNCIVHRDLSSNNILLSGSTQIVNCRRICAKVSDFGISRLIDSERFDKTLSTVAPGTKGYMPPESWKCDGKYDEKFDIFSYGVLVVQTITMLSPNPNDRVNSSGRIVPEVTRRRKHIIQLRGHPMQDLALKCLQDNKDDRPAAGKVCQILQQLFILSYCNCLLRL